MFCTPDNNNYATQYVLNNSHIKIDNKLFFSNLLLIANVYCVKDFFDVDGQPLDYNTFITKNILPAFPFTTYLGIIRAIPNVRKHNLFPHQLCNENIQRLICFCSTSKPSQHVYYTLISKIVSTPTALKKWSSLLYNPPDWKTIFNISFIAVRNSKLQYFQFRFLHRIFGVNSFLYKINVSDSPLCTFCKNEPETLEHLFWTCNFTQTFWNRSHTLYIKNIFDIDLNKQVTFFGYTIMCHHPINFYLLHAKYYIFCCKLNNIRPNALTFFHKFKFCIEVEKYITKDNINHFKLFKETFVALLW